MSVRSIFEEEEVVPSFSTMQLPTPLLKYGQQGYPHFRYFFLNKSKTCLIWHSDKKKSVPTKIDIAAMSRLEKGQKSDIFRKNNASKSHPEHLSFSLYYKIGSNEKSLDVVCKDQMECDIWVRGLIYLIKNKERIIAEAGDVAEDVDHFNGNIKLVNVKNLHEQMHAHLDLCTWGTSQWGQLGHSEVPNEVRDESAPKKVRHLVDHDVDLKFVDCGECHTVAISKSGECYAWGNAYSGRLGVVVSGENSWEDVQAGAGISHVLIPRVIEGLKGIPIKSVACGSAHTLFLSEDCRLYATGCNISGQLGTGDCVDHLTPVHVPVPGGLSVLSISAGDQFSALIATDEVSSSIPNQQHLYTWGSNIYGNLGHGDTENRLTATRVEALASNYSISSLSCGSSHIAAIATAYFSPPSAVDEQSESLGMDEDEIKLEREDSAVFNNESFSFDDRNAAGNARIVLLSWGWGLCGQLGHGDFDDSYTPKAVEYFQPPTMPVKVSCGSAHTACVVENPSSGSSLYIWGAGPTLSNEGNMPNSNVPVLIDSARLATKNDKGEEFDIYRLIQDISCGDLHTMILTGEGMLHVFGALSPLLKHVNRVENLSDDDAKAISSGGNHLAVLLARKWIKDEDADKCMNCEKEFTFVNRQHHCRSCGGIYCGDCTKKRAPVLKYGYQEPVRVCDTCYTRITNGTM